MKQVRGRLVEIHFAGGLVGGSLACPSGMLPGAGQYLLAVPVDHPEALGVPLFPAGWQDGMLRLAPPLPPAWQPGLELDVRGPLGRGFHLPPAARRLALAVLDAGPARLLPLMTQVLAAGGEVALFADFSAGAPGLADLPGEVEVDALAAFPAALPWADAACFDLPAAALPGLRARLGLKPGGRLTCPAQALVLAPMPCAGLADCGVCALPLRGSRGYQRTSYALACKDGPVFDLDTLEW